MNTSSGTSTMVSTDSLRAAALSTLKAKRRKPVPERPPAPPSRPIPSSDSLALDYGQEEQAQARDNTSAAAATSAIPPKPIVPDEKEKPAPVVEDAQMREEGEISEEDEPPPPTPPLPPPKQPPLRRRQLPSTSPPRYPPRRLIEEKPPPPPQRKASTPEVKKLAPAPVLLDRISSAPEPIQLKQEPMDISLDSLRLEDQLSLPSVGPNRVRPGLDMTQQEYDTVKEIILDLLGWGVPFDYLVTCGISREVVFYVFNELNLRLPDSFDVSGIAPYTPESLTKVQQSTSMPPPPIPKQRRGSVEAGPAAMANVSPKAGPSTPAPLSSTPSTESPLAADLHDMERQRRQELLARKAAVQASRKLKQSLSATSSSETAPGSLPAPPAATETVEDFLKSLGPVQPMETTRAIVSSPRPIEEPAAMDVDQDKDKEIKEQVFEKQEPIPVSSAVSEQSTMSSTRSPTDETPPTSVGSSTTSFPDSSASTPGTPAATTFSGAATRRGLKRPVASDFVDVDPAPKRHESGGRALQANGAVRPVGITRRLNSGSGFSNIGNRRCVIDLSDSEDEGEEAQQVEEQLKRPKSTSYPSPAPGKPASLSGPLSPGALMQKEMEIRKMRELIAQREEETRLRKLALAKSAAANAMGASRSSTPVVQPPVSDVVMASPTTDMGDASGPAPQGSQSSGSATPPPSVEPSARTQAPSPIGNGDVHADSKELPVSDDNGQGKSPSFSYPRICVSLSSFN